MKILDGKVPPDLEKILREQIRRRIKESLTDWAEVALFQYGQKPARHHQLLIRHLEALEAGIINRLMIFMPPGSAKALAIDTPIPTPSGWMTMGELRVGDTVFDENGKPCRVTWKSEVWKDRPVFEVTTDCGDKIIADQDHEWLVRLCGKPRKPSSELKNNIGGRGRSALPEEIRDDPSSRFKIKETWELARKRAKRPMIARAKALELPNADLPLDPYVLGLWLGDGSSGSGMVTAHPDDQPFYKKELLKAGYFTTERSEAYNFGIVDIRKHLVSLGILNDPQHGVVGKKRIPEIYLRASKDQRLSLLQGLIDTDGTVCKKRGCTTFSNSNYVLASQVRELIRSLGVKAGWSESRAIVNGKDCGPHYSVSFYLEDSARLPRKAELARNQFRTPNTYIDVVPAGRADTVCIEVDSPSHLFLCGLSMTPTHNSTYTSVLFPAWVMARKMNFNILAASHTADLAEDFSKRVQSFVKEFKDVLGYAPSNEAANLWGTSNGGRYRAAGVGGPIAGFRADGVLVDDPVKNRKDADSPTYRDTAYNWFRADVLPRLRPNSFACIIQTRWHEDDLSGRLLNDNPDLWKVLSLPAIANDENDALGRAIGEPLWNDDPNYKYGELLTNIRQEQGERDWFALYQQSPRPMSGGIFKTEKISVLEAAPAGMQMVRAWDLASTAATGGRDPDWTVGALMGRTPQGGFVVADLVRLRGGPDEVEAAIVATASRDGRRIDISLPQDPGQAGASQVLYLTRKLAGYKVLTSRETGDKATRAAPFASQVNVGNVSFVNAPWNKAALEEMASFPGSAHDDIVDACSRAFDAVHDTSIVDRFAALAS